jgi:site-specific DNA-methyltransferase (adenine-specific)
MKEIPDGSVDMVLTDPPYGTTKCSWDSIIDLPLMWEQLKRVIKPNGAIVMTASQPFTTTLIASNMKMFKYCWVWEKHQSSGFVQCKNKPMNNHEDVVVFSTGVTVHAGQSKRRMTYNPQGLVEVNKIARGASPSKGAGGITKRPSHKDKVLRTHTGYPKTVIKFSGDRGLHPTQKPVALMEYLIKTYTNEGDAVLDFTAGSFTTGVACVNINRKFIGIEMDEGYFDIGVGRIKERIKCLDLKIEPTISTGD